MKHVKSISKGLAKSIPKTAGPPDTSKKCVKFGKCTSVC